jgi:hypothetical protein
MTDATPRHFDTGDQKAGQKAAPAGEGLMAQALREFDKAGAALISNGTSESAFAQAPLPEEKSSITHLDTGQEGLYDSVMAA